MSELDTTATHWGSESVFRSCYSWLQSLFWESRPRSRPVPNLSSKREQFSHTQSRRDLVLDTNIACVWNTSEQNSLLQHYCRQCPTKGIATDYSCNHEISGNQIDSSLHFALCVLPEVQFRLLFPLLLTHDQQVHGVALGRTTWS